MSIVLAVFASAVAAAAPQDQAPQPPVAAVHAELAATALFVLRDDAIWTCDGNGRNARQWSPVGRPIATPLELAPDGRCFALAQGGLGLLDERGDVRTLDAFDGWASRPIWSADGRALAFGTTEQTVGEGAVWLCTDTGAPKGLLRLPAEHGYAGEPAFAPDGTLLAFAAEVSHEVEQSHDVVFVRHKSRVEVFDRATGKRTVACEQAGEIFAVAWSPDGRHLAFELDGTVLVVPMAGPTPGPARRLLTRVRNGGPFAWSPDGGAVLAARSGVSAGPGAHPVDAILLAPLHGEPRELALPTTIYDCAFAPGGAWLAVTDGECRLLRVDVATGAQQVLLTGCEHWSPVWWRPAPTARAPDDSASDDSGK